MSKALESLEEILSSAYGLGLKMDLRNQLITIEQELEVYEFVKKCFYVAKSSGAILLTDYGFEHKEELKKELLDR